MADRVFMPRALDTNGDIVTDATAYFYESGTTTPLIVYSDSDGAIPLGTTTAGDSSGVFDPVFTTEAVRVDIQDGDDVSLPGFPSDGWYVVPSTGVGASTITYDPQEGNTATNVQMAINNLTALWVAATTYGRSLIATADAAAARVVLGLGGLSTLDLLDEDSFASNSATRPPSQQSTKVYVDAVAADLIGVGQSWSDVSGSRSASTSYQNTTGRSIQWVVQGSSGGNIQVSTNNSTWVTLGTLGAPASFDVAVSVIIPPSHYYKTTGAFSDWSELR